MIRDKNTITGGIFVIIMFCFLMFVIADCSMGTSKTLHGKILRTEHIPKRVEHYYSDNKLRTRTTDEKWIIYVQLNKHSNVVEINANKRLWLKYKENDEAYVRMTIGHYTKFGYGSRLVEMENR